MKRLSMGLKHGDIKEIALFEHEDSYLGLGIFDRSGWINVSLTRQEAEWFLKLLQMHVEERGYDD